MSGLFDRLQNEIESNEKEGGISPLDLVELSPLLKKIVRKMLREVEMTFDELWEFIQGLPDESQISQSELSKTMETLSKQGWAISMGESGNMRYKVNLRRKPGSTLAQGIWSALNDKIEKRTKGKLETDDEG